MGRVEVVYVMYDGLRMSAPLAEWEQELERVKGWQDSIQNKQAIIAKLEEGIARKKASGA